MKKYALVTGERGGIGLEVANQLVEKGYDVIGLDLAPLPDQTKKWQHHFQVDICDQEALKNVYREVSQFTDRLEAVVNVAGIMHTGSLIEEDVATIKKIFDVNVFGTYSVNQIFFPMLLKAKGRVINFSSEYGCYATAPFSGFYTASKHAVEAYSDGLRRELACFDIPVITVRPGAFKTDMEKGAHIEFEKFLKKTQLYQEALKRMMPLLESSTKNAKPASIIGAVTVKAVTDPKPKRIYKSNHNIGMKILSKMPLAIQDRVFIKMLKG